MATEMSSCGSNEWLDELDLEYGTLQPPENDFLVAPQIEVLEPFHPAAAAIHHASSETSNEFQAHSAGRGGSNVGPVLGPYFAVINHVSDGAQVHRVRERPHADTILSAPHLRSTIGGPIILGIDEESGSFNFNVFIMPAEASPGLTVLGRGGRGWLTAVRVAIGGHTGSQAVRGGHAVGGELNGEMLTALRRAMEGHNGPEAVLDDILRGATEGHNGSQAVRGGHAVGGELNGEMLTALRRAMEGHNGPQAVLYDILRRATGGHTGSQSVRGGHAVEGELNGEMLTALRRAMEGHNGPQAVLYDILRRATRGHTSSQAVRGGHAVEGELNGEMLTALRRAMEGHNGSQAALDDILRRVIGGHTGSQAVLVVVYETGGHFLAIHINPPQQAEQGFRAERALQSVFGGLVPLCYTVVDGILKGGSPGYIRAIVYALLVLITGFTFVGLVSKKRANAAIRAVASTAIAAASTALVYSVSDNVYIKCVCGIIGAVATLATAAINW